MSSSHHMFNLDKLIGRENFATWKFSVKTYLEHEDLWQCVEPNGNEPVDSSKDIKARSKLILLLDPQNYIHVQSCNTAKEVWENLQRAFDDNGLTRRVGLLKDLVDTTLESKFCTSAQGNKTENEKGKKDTGFIAAFSAFSGKNKWFMDSGASMHMTGNRHLMYNVTEPPVKEITVANKEQLSVGGVRYTDVRLAQGKNIQLKNVLFVPDLAVNLLSVSAIVNSGYKVTFTQRGCDVHDSHGKFICSATLNNKLYILDTEISPETAHLSSSEEKGSDTYLWHLRMGHLNVPDVNRLPDCVKGVTLTNMDKNVTRCVSCCEGKQSRLPFNPSTAGIDDVIARFYDSFQINIDKKQTGPLISVL